MQRVFDEKDKVMEAFLQNPDFRNYGFFATQGNPLNAYAQYPKEPPNMGKDQGVGPKAFSQSDIKTSMPLGIFSQMSRGAPGVDVASVAVGQNFMQPQHQAMMLESALRMRFGEQAFMHQQPGMQHPGQPIQENKVTAAHTNQQRNVYACGVATTVAGSSRAGNESSSRATNMSSSSQAGGQGGGGSGQQAGSSGGSSSSGGNQATGSGQHMHGGGMNRNARTPEDLSEHAQQQQQQAQQQAQQQVQQHAQQLAAGVKKGIPPEQITAFMREMQKLASTEVGKAMIPPQTLATMMEQMQQTAEEILGDGSPDSNLIRIKSEFSGGATPGGGDDPRNLLSPEQQHYLTPITDAKLKSELATHSLLAFNHELRFKGLGGTQQQPMPLVVQPSGNKAGNKTSTSTAASGGIVPLSNEFFSVTNMSTKNSNKKQKERPHVCGTCHMAFTQKNHLQVHERKHTGEKPFRCTMCDAAFARKDGLVIHQRKHTGEKPFQCSMCDAAFARKDGLVVHERKHTGIKPYRCMVCGSTFARKDKLVIHHRIHTGIKPYRCMVCGSTFARKDQLVIHHRIHTGIKPYRCTMCEATFARKDGLVIHQRKHTGIKPFRCNMCEATFARKDGLIIHQRKHTGIKPFRCTMCDATFARKDWLVIHHRKHTGIKPYRCNMCDAAFIRKDGLVIHQRKHTGEKPYKCHFCEKAFARKDKMVYHVRTHLGKPEKWEKPFKCQFCTKAFVRKDKMVAHIKTHLGKPPEKWEKPYKCSFCDSAFTRKDKMVIHERTHTGERPYQCTHCDSKYTRKDKLTIHMRKHALAAQKDLEKALQTSLGVASSLALHQAGPHALILQSGMGGATGVGPGGALGLPGTGVVMAAGGGALGGLGHPSGLMLNGPPHNTGPGALHQASLASSMVTHSIGSVAQLGSFTNTLTANLVLPPNLQNSLAANLAAANLSIQSVANSIGIRGADTGPANLSMHDGAGGGGNGAVTDLSLHNAGATNLSTTPMSSGN